ncbi:MAG: adenylate/guanylate cyclase domain-containing protein [Alphaproteobacteria bacterium]|nr:adenylate/guanylate cyclase domain-containing protein [Alphaproteobacteria bacterium]
MQPSHGTGRGRHPCAPQGAAPGENERIQFRVGINSGDVIVEDGDIHGNGVNIAARLEGIAEPGTIFVSGIVLDQGRLDCAFESIGEHCLKNIARPVCVYRIGPKRPSRTLLRMRGGKCGKRAGWGLNRHCRCPTSRRSRCCPSPI